MSLPARLLVITDRTQADRTLAEIAGAVCGPDGCEWLLFRDKDLPVAERRELALVLRDITREAGTAFSVSADVALARECGADGVHLQSMDDIPHAREVMGPAGLIGFSAHGIAEVDAAQRAGADYVTLSPIFASPSKPGYGPALGLEGLSAAASRAKVLALAGVEPGNARACLDAGAAGVAVMGSVMRAADPLAEIRRYREALGL